jgi:hypothetical protein
VFVHGDWDTQTPIENTFQVAPYFPNSHVLIVERGGHGAMNQITQTLPDTAAALLDFLKTGSSTPLPTRVTLPPQRFNVPTFPAPSKTEKTAFQTRQPQGRRGSALFEFSTAAVPLGRVATPRSLAQRFNAGKMATHLQFIASR